MNKRKHYSANFKTQVVIEVIREEATVNDIATKYGIHPVMLSRWFISNRKMSCLAVM